MGEVCVCAHFIFLATWSILMKFGMEYLQQKQWSKFHFGIDPFIKTHISHKAQIILVSSPEYELQLGTNTVPVTSDLDHYLTTYRHVTPYSLVEG
jgi:hypothetical protein